MGPLQHRKRHRKMPLISDVKNDFKAAMKIRLPWWCQLSIFIVCLVTYLVFVHTRVVDVEMPVLMSIAVLGFTIAVKWNLRPYAWFWITMVVLAALHGLLILFVPWTSKWVPAPAVAAIASADLIVVLAIVDVLARFIGRQASAAIPAESTRFLRN